LPGERKRGFTVWYEKGAKAYTATKNIGQQDHLSRDTPKLNQNVRKKGKKRRAYFGKRVIGLNLVKGSD